MPLDDTVRTVLQDALAADVRAYGLLQRDLATRAAHLAESRADLAVRSRRIAAVQAVLDADDLELLAADDA